MNYILFGDTTREELLPLTFTRPVSDIRFGILTIREKWEKFLNAKTSTLTVDYLAEKYPIVKGSDNILINGTICPNPELIEKLKELKPNQALSYGDLMVAFRVTGEDLNNFDNIEESNLELKNKPLKVDTLWDIFTKNDLAIKQDFELLTKGRKSAEVSKSNTLIKPENIFVEEGAKLEAVILNASTGPIYIGKDSEIMEGSVIRGSFALCENSVIKMNSKIYGATTIGPFSKVGGEVSNSVIFGYSNKAHDGFLGDSVVGEWCNIGADSNNSNLKNNYSDVKLWNYAQKRFNNTNLQFCGLIMGDHSKCGINTMFNTGTVVGVSSNIYGTGFQRNFIPSFSWGGVSGFTTYDIDKAIDVAQRVYERRGKVFDDIEKRIFKNIYRQTIEYRNYVYQNLKD